MLAAGGFGRDLELRMTQDPRLNKEVDCTNQPGATGEVLLETLRVGAMPVQLSWIQLGPWASPDEEGFGIVPQFSVPAACPWGIIVDPETGKRFVNELTDRKRKADAILETGHPVVNLCDSLGAKKTPPGFLERGLEKKSIRKFDTIDDLAGFYEIPVEALKETIARYNSFVKKGVDSDFGKPIPGGAQPLTHPLFYAARLWPKVHHCMGGVRINTSAQVIGLNGEAIPGLYAAGEVTGGIHGACRLGSVATADCIVFGRTAGQSAAREQARG